MTASLQTPAYAAFDPKSPLGPHTITRRAPRDHEVLIDIRYCGVCHTDIHFVQNDWGRSVYPLVPGHEIVGHVAAVGSGVTRHKVGDAVGVGCFVDSCRVCSSCKEGEEQYCEKGFTSTYNSVERDGVARTYGGYSTRITVDEQYVLRMPASIPLERAAPLLCAGITTYSPLKFFGVEAGDSVAVVGLGGLGHIAVKIAKAMGARVTVLSTSPGKRGDALELGADDFAATRDPETFKTHLGKFDFILDTVSAQHDYNAYLGLLKRDGRMVLVGLPEPTPLAAGALIMGRKSLTGSLIGGIRETQEMLDFCAAHGIASDIELIPMAHINQAYERMVRGDVRYRFVIDTSSLQPS